MQGEAIQTPYLGGNVFGTVPNRFGLNQTYRQGLDIQSPVFDVKGKGKFKEPDFDAAFAQVTSSFEMASVKVKDEAPGIEDLAKDLGQATLDDVTPEDIRDVEFRRLADPCMPTM